VIGGQQKFLTVEYGRIGALRIVDPPYCAPREVAGVGHKESWEECVEWFVEEEADPVLGLELDHIEREVIGESETGPCSEQGRAGSRNGVDQLFVIVAERVEVLAATRSFEVCVEVCQGWRVGIGERSQDWA